MSYLTDARWYLSSGGGVDIQPQYVGYSPLNMDSSEFTALSAAIRQAFAFFRRHGDRRYSAASLMRLMDFADRIDAGERENLPSLVTCEVPFTYDEDTEVKSGGIIGIAVMLPDNRTMIAVHTQRRKARVGTSLIRFVRDYFTSYPVVWAHRANTQGAAFLAACGLMPWAVNTSGAVQYCERVPGAEENEAVQEENDYAVDELLAQRRNGGRSTSMRGLRRHTLENAIRDHRPDTYEIQPLSVYQETTQNIPDLGWLDELAEAEPVDDESPRCGNPSCRAVECDPNGGGYLFANGVHAGRSIAEVWESHSSYVISAQRNPGNFNHRTRTAITRYLSTIAPTPQDVPERQDA